MINLKDFSNISWEEWGNMISTQSDADKDIFLKNFDILDKKVNIATRSLDYYDLYKFVGSVDSQDSYRIAYAGLANNRALAVIADFGNYHTGDIILKDDFGKEIHITTKQAGIFVPSDFSTSNNQLQLTYTVYNNINELPSDPSDPIHYNNNQATIPLDILEGDNIYSFYVTNSGNTSIEEDLTLKISDGVIIYPMIKFYNSEGEEVYYDGCRQEQGSSAITITIPPKLTAVGR